MKKKLVSAMLIAAMAISMTACGSSAGSSNGSAGDADAGSAEADNGGAEEASTEDTGSSSKELYINLASEPSYLDPALNSTVDGGCLASNSFAGLYTYGEDGSLKPQLATDMPEVSEDETVYTIHLIESKWSNGEDLTANDFVYSWNRVINPDTAADYAYLFDVVARNDDGTLAVKAVDDYTLEIALNSPCPYFNELLAFPCFFPVYQAGVEEADPDGQVPGKWAQEAGFVCNGAYTLKEWKHDQSMVYVKNENYYDAENVTMDELHFMLSSDDTAIYAAYNSGDLDLIDTVPTEEIPSLKGNEEFKTIDTLGTYYIGFNVHDSIFEGKTVEQAAKMREAMSLLIDRQYIVDNIAQTGQQLADSFVPAGMADGNGGEFKTADVSYYDASATGAGMVEDAKALFEEAGYSFEEDGNGGYKISPALAITYLTNDTESHIKIGEAIQQDFALLGIQMEIKSEDWNVFLEDRKAGNFTLAREGWIADYNDPVNMLEIFTKSSGNNDMQLGKGESEAAPDWAEYEKLIKDIRKTTDFEKRVGLMHDAEDILMDTWAVVPLYYYNDIFMQKSNVDGIYTSVTGMKYFMYATKS